MIIESVEVIVTSSDRNFVTLELTTERIRTGVPGLGVDLDVDEVGEYSYVHAYLPLNRLVDGTVHDW